jgi:hypothetical protein
MVKDTFVSVSRKILETTSYTGGRDGIAESNGYMVIWSNNRGDWMCSGRGFRKGDRIYLDADRVPVYATRSEIESWVSRLPILPLYQNSFEVWSEGRDPTKKGRESTSRALSEIEQRERAREKLREDAKKYIVARYMDEKGLDRTKAEQEAECMLRMVEESDESCIISSKKRKTRW